MSKYEWAKPYTFKFFPGFLSPVGDHPTFQEGENLHCQQTRCRTYTIIRQDTCKVFLLFRGNVLQRKSAYDQSLKDSI
jgi:hypothetical protein